jgi:hypothetical protein
MINEKNLQETVKKQIEKSIETQIENRIKTKLLNLYSSKYDETRYYSQNDIQNFIKDISVDLSIIFTSKVQDKKKPVSTKIAGYSIDRQNKSYSNEAIIKYVENLLTDFNF